MKQTITENALFQRLKRKLAHEELVLHRSKRGGSLNNLGTYHITDLRTNTVTCSGFNLVEMAREEGVMHPSEVLEAEQN